MAARSRLVAVRIRALIGVQCVEPTGRTSFSCKRAQQLGLQIECEFSDLVQEDRSASRRNQEAILGVICAGEGALDIAEKLALDQGGHEGPAVHRQKRFFRVGPEAVNGARHQFLAGAALSENQDRVIGVRNLGEDAVKLFHLRRAANHLAHSFLRPQASRSCRARVSMW